MWFTLHSAALDDFRLFHRTATAKVTPAAEAETT